MTTVTFARGGSAPKASAKGAKPSIVQSVVNTVTGTAPGGGFLNGTVNGKKGFQPGNTYGGNRKGGSSPAVKASGAHRSARAVVSKHIKAGTIRTKEGMAAVRTAAAAHRELQSARSAVVSAKGGEAKAARAVASGRASSLPKPGDTPKSAPAPVAKPTIEKQVKASAKEASGIKVDMAHQHLGDLHAGTKAGALKPTDIHAHVDRIARGTSKDELFAAAKKAGIEHTQVTKKGLVEHLKDHHHEQNLAAIKAKATPKDLSTKEFADRVVQGAHASPTGGFGDEKTFINHAKAQLDKTDPHIAKMTDSEFKGRLLEAHHAGHLELGRADLVDAMHPHDVKASDTAYLNANYHFIRHPAASKAQSRRPS